MKDNEMEKIAIEKKFFLLESLHYRIYNMLSNYEKRSYYKRELRALADVEKKHSGIWRSMLLDHGVDDIHPGAYNEFRFILFAVFRRIFGLAFATKYLERDEDDALLEYGKLLDQKDRFTNYEMKKIREIIKDEEVSENDLNMSLSEKSGDLDYIKSIVFGLNDGLVEVLAAVAGLAVLATSSLVVIIGGIIVGLSGTLSMAGGAYLAAKSSEMIAERNMVVKEHNHASPKREALYTGVYYFIGSLVSVLPFIFGLSGFAGIIAAIILVIVALSVASIVISIISGSNIKRHMAEMIAISLAAAFATIILGSILKFYFGIAI